MHPRVLVIRSKSGRNFVTGLDFFSPPTITDILSETGESLRMCSLLAEWAQRTYSYNDLLLPCIYKISGELQAEWRDTVNPLLIKNYSKNESHLVTVAANAKLIYFPFVHRCYYHYKTNWKANVIKLDIFVRHCRWNNVTLRFIVCKNVLYCFYTSVWQQVEGELFE